MKTFKLLLTLALSVALAIGVMTAIQSCSKDNSPSVPAMKLTLNCSVKSVEGDKTYFDVTCEADRSVLNSEKYFYADTVPYSENKDPENVRFRVGMMASQSTIQEFMPQHEASKKYNLDEGEMLVLHNNDGIKKYYIGAYVVINGQKIWSEPYEYEAPQTFKVSIAIMEVKANSVDFEVRFSRAVSDDYFVGDLTCTLTEWNPIEGQKEQYLTLTPYKGEKAVLKGTFEGMLPNREYDISLPYKTPYVENYIFTESFITPAE